MKDIQKIIELADTYNLEITIVPSSKYYVIDIRRYIPGHGKTDRWIKSTRFTEYEIDSLNMEFEDVLKEIDKNFSEAYQRFLEEKRDKNSEKVIGTNVCSITDKVCIDKDCRICDINKQVTTKKKEKVNDKRRNME